MCCSHPVVHGERDIKNHAWAYLASAIRHHRSQRKAMKQRVCPRPSGCGPTLRCMIFKVHHPLTCYCPACVSLMLHQAETVRVARTRGNSGRRGKIYARYDSPPESGCAQNTLRVCDCPRPMHVRVSSPPRPDREVWPTGFRSNIPRSLNSDYSQVAGLGGSWDARHQGI